MKALQDGDPRLVGPYELLGVLGAGGMGRVYLGRRADALVAVKVVNEELAQNADFIARFRREVTAARAMSGPYFAATLDFDVDCAQPWLATEYVPGPTLNAVVAEHGPLDTVSVRALGVRLAEALAAIHAAELVHRDVKPGNILLGPDGPRLIDFGIARSAAVTTLTQTGVVLGTPQFMAPEQLQVRGRVGPAADVFALGLVLAFAATGEHPFGQTDSFGFGFRIVHEEPELDRVPADLVGLVRRCLTKDPAERPTPADLVAALTLGEETLDQTGLAVLIRHAGDTGIPALSALPTPTEANTLGPGRPRRRPALLVLAAVVTAGTAATLLLVPGTGTPPSLADGFPRGTAVSTAPPSTTSARPSASSSPTTGAPATPPPGSAAPSTPPATTVTTVTAPPPGAGYGAAGGVLGTTTTGGGTNNGTTSGGSSNGSSGSGSGNGAGGGSGGGSTGTQQSAPPAAPAPKPSPTPTPQPVQTPVQPKGSAPAVPAAYKATFDHGCFGACDMPFTMTWNAQSDATRYEIQYDNQTSGVKKVLSTSGTSYDVQGPYSGDHVCIALRAANQYGTSAWTTPTTCFDTPY
ncbi:serine/threonine protein kinase [Kitasatospora sp. MMS16-BH015]|uniref:serine/threonine-protein kinase n=1 Tax=Kitasatospora sp. MMS16-BH015 TaxID=2018025 RepID=UPI000CA12364|nr:serine/threonine-protein kinase [Kitasatospora sp. MMS16-BH015]AUG79422.1 serine/threonine protein kinase [Kitasatospora sp. MMS16-BH015]